MTRLALLAALCLAAPALSQDSEQATPGSVVAAATPEEWRGIAPEDVLVMELAPDPAGRPRQVVIQLMPLPFSQPWVENIRALARSHWWDGTSVYRVVDNFVTQWGGGEGEGFPPRPLPDGIASPVEPYEIDEPQNLAPPGLPLAYQGDPAAQSPTTFAGQKVFRGARSWEYAAFANGFPYSGSMDPHQSKVWPIHCYAHVGVARDLAPDTGTGAELYAVIGHAPRALDRNIAVVGRVIEGIEHLSTLPRGTGDAGVYASRAEDTPIISARLASELPDPPRFEYLASDSASFARYVEVRANRSDSFYQVPAGGVDICAVQVPVRRVAAEG